MNRITDKDIIFDMETSINEDMNEINVYLCENDILDKIAGLYTQFDYDNDGNYFGHNDHWNVNYYATYSFESNSFYVEACVTKYSNDEELKELYPDIIDNIFDYYCNENILTSTPIDLSMEETDFIFNKFKDYVVKDYNMEDFNQVLDNIKEQLEFDNLEI